MKNIIGERIRMMRKNLKMRPDKLAELIRCYGYDIKTNMVYFYEQGRSKPNSELIEIICKIGGVCPCWLFGYSDGCSPENHNHHGAISSIAVTLPAYNQGAAVGLTETWRNRRRINMAYAKNRRA